MLLRHGGSTQYGHLEDCPLLKGSWFSFLADIVAAGSTNMLKLVIKSGYVASEEVMDAMKAIISFTQKGSLSRDEGCKLARLLSK